MEIVSGKARGVKLFSPDTGDEVRPTSVRARKAFFDSLGVLDGCVFADLFAGSGAMGLEAASRGAGRVIFVDSSRDSIRNIEKNCGKLERLGIETKFQILSGELPGFSRRIYNMSYTPDIIFADPPYTNSSRMLEALTGNTDFGHWAGDAIMYWELPDGGVNLRPPLSPWRLTAIKSLGPARFMVLKQDIQ